LPIALGKPNLRPWPRRFRTGANLSELHDEPEFSDDYGKADERERRTSREDFVPPFWGH